jgi:hypothetical protein
VTGLPTFEASPAAKINECNGDVTPINEVKKLSDALDRIEAVNADRFLSSAQMDGTGLSPSKNVY